MSRPRIKKASGAPRRSNIPLWRSWYDSKAPLFRFCLKFCALMIVFYALSFTPECQRIISLSDTGNARVAGAMLNRLGEGTQVTNATVASAKFAVTVLPACSAIGFLLFFCATVIAFPSRLSRKISGILIGVTLLLALNTVRIASLYYVGVHFPAFFEATHEDFWSIALILAEVILCAAWIGWARKNERPEIHAAA